MSRWENIEKKVLSSHKAQEKSSVCRLKNQKVVFTNGCFDLLHLGHVTYLAQAASLGDYLIVGINDDASVRQLGKGPNRPINTEMTRALIVASLAFVSAVVVFSEATPLELITSIKPDVLVKGGDYSPVETNVNSPQYMVGSKEVLALGGQVVSIPLVEGYSTTSILGKV